MSGFRTPSDRRGLQVGVGATAGGDPDPCGGSEARATLRPRDLGLESLKLGESLSPPATLLPGKPLEEGGGRRLPSRYTPAWLHAVWSCRSGASKGSWSRAGAVGFGAPRPGHTASPTLLLLPLFLKAFPGSPGSGDMGFPSATAFPSEKRPGLSWH